MKKISHKNSLVEITYLTDEKKMYGHPLNYFLLICAGFDAKKNQNRPMGTPEHIYKQS